MNYYDELTKAMTMIGEVPNSLFIGQSVRFGGQAMKRSLVSVPNDRLIEFPVAEDCQMGFCTGLAMTGFLPVCIYPRIDFMLLCLNQLVNHLDKMDNPPKVIIRTSVGSNNEKWNAGVQHTNDFTGAFSLMLKNVGVLELWKAEDIVPAYQWATEREGSTILIERVSKY
jgi:pyruvate dehydrogenase E1 component beta subunit